MNERTRRKHDAEEQLKKARNEAHDEAPEAENEEPGDRARHLTPGIGWTRGKDIEDTRSQKKAPHDTHTGLDRSGEKKYERAAKKFAHRGKR